MKKSSWKIIEIKIIPSRCGIQQSKLMNQIKMNWRIKYALYNWCFYALFFWSEFLLYQTICFHLGQRLMKFVWCCRHDQLRFLSEWLFIRYQHLPVNLLLMNSKQEYFAAENWEQLFRIVKDYWKLYSISDPASLKLCVILTLSLWSSDSRK